VPLPSAPLVRVLTQVRFPPIWSIADPTAIAPFQEVIRATYPLSTKEVVQHIELSPERPAVQADTIWRFQDRAEEWRVSLGTSFIALETTKYASRKDFLSRVGSLIDSLRRTVNPQLATRIGLRYVDRLDGAAVEQIEDLLRPEVLGSYTLFEGAVRNILANAEFATEEGATLTARWGMLPSGKSFDPNVLPPIKERSWVIDLDMYTTAQTDFAVAALSPQLEGFAKRIYAVFRYMVRDEFLTYYGGRL
jgi:uncharacterized protein (TIGR04255 family)